MIVKVYALTSIPASLVAAEALTVIVETSETWAAAEDRIRAYWRRQRWPWIPVDLAVATARERLWPHEILERAPLTKVAH